MSRHELTSVQTDSICCSRMRFFLSISWRWWGRMECCGTDLIRVCRFRRVNSSFCAHFSRFNSFLQRIKTSLQRRCACLVSSFNYSCNAVEFRVRWRNRLIRISKRRWRVFNVCSSLIRLVIWLDSSMDFIRSEIWSKEWRWSCRQGYRPITSTVRQLWQSFVLELIDVGMISSGENLSPIVFDSWIEVMKQKRKKLEQVPIENFISNLIFPRQSNQININVHSHKYKKKIKKWSLKGYSSCSSRTIVTL